jgi:hypothetical protein
MRLQDQSLSNSPQTLAMHLFQMHIKHLYNSLPIFDGTKNMIDDEISQQPENCENRHDPDLVQAFLKKWWVESDFKAPK